MACQSQFSEESNAHGLSADKLPALDASCMPPALVESTAKRQRFQLDECDPLKGRYTESVTLAALRRDEPHMRDVFNRHKDLDNGLSKAAFIAALREVAAPVLFSRDQEGVYKLADTNMNDSVDFSEFMFSANFSDELEKLLQRHNLSALAPALRAHGIGNDPLGSLAGLSEEDLDAAVVASVGLMCKELRKVHEISKATVRHREQLGESQGKFKMRKMKACTLSEIKEGLASLTGPPCLNFEAAMAAEHCTMGGCDYEFTYPLLITSTTPRQEWFHVVSFNGGQHLSQSDMSNGRRLLSIDECLRKSAAIRAGLNRAEIIALIMFTGPMIHIYNPILRRYPKEQYEFFEKVDNRFSSTIFAFCSAMVKLSRVSSLTAGTKVYRGIGGDRQLPDSFFEADEFGTMSFVEPGYMATTAQLEVALDYSGARDGKPLPQVIVLQVGAVDRKVGAVNRPCDTKEFSQYPAETLWFWPPLTIIQPDGDSWVVQHHGRPVTMIPVRATVHQFKTIEQMQLRKKGEHMNSFRTVMANTVQKLEREASDKSLTEKQRAQKLSNMHEIVVQMKDIMKRHQDLDIQHFVDDLLYRDVMTEMLNSVELTFMGRFIIKGDHHEYKSATCVVFISTDIKGGIKCPVALKFMKNAVEFEQEKSSRLKLKGSDAADISKFIVDIRDSFDCSHAQFEESLNGSSNFVINSKLQDYPSLIVMPAADRNLRAIMDNERITDPTALKRMFHEILLAVKYMHDRGVIHGDIKPRNVVRINEQLVIIDLDASAEIGKQFSWSKYSSAYLPPEAIAIRRHECAASLSCTTSASVRCFASERSASCSCVLADAANAPADSPRECSGLCGLAHRSHDLWSLGVLLYRFSARESLFSENDDDNIKEDSGHLLQLALWTGKFKNDRLQKIDDTATRTLVSRLLQKDPRMRPCSIADVLAMPFNEMDVIKMKLEQMIAGDSSKSSNLVGNVRDLVTGKFGDAAYGLRSYLKVADSWNEAAACELRGIEDEIDGLKDCPDCVRAQAAALLRLGRNKAAATTLKLADALSSLKHERHHGAASQTAAHVVEVLRSQLSAAEGWHYGLQNCITWPPDTVQVTQGCFTKTFCQPMCTRCQGYSLDYSSIIANLNYIVREAAVEETFWNGVRDRGRGGHRLADFMGMPQAVESKLTKAELVALRLYTSHSFESINKPLRDMSRQEPHPLPGVVTNIYRGLKKLRALGSNDASSKQTVVLWRGMSAMKFSDEFTDEGGTELAPMSTTTNVSVAIRYAIKKDTRSALLFRFVTRNNLERGADVQWLSMFPGESETLFPPLTFIQKTRSEAQVVEHNGVTVSVVELSTSLA